MRVTNTTREVVPMYWWSNIAVPEDEGARVITWANGSYVANNNVSEVPIPIQDGVDVSYPENIQTAMDNFYNIPEGKRKFECMIRRDGYGFVQTSTSRLQGRKLFVWGQGNGRQALEKLPDRGRLQTADMWSFRRGLHTASTNLSRCPPPPPGNGLRLTAR